MIKTVIGTHNGVFHADEVLAIALLLWQLNYELEEVRIIRSRDENMLALADATVDVGGRYDESKNYFDHHQFEKTNSLYGKSSAGLVAMSMDLTQYPTLNRLIKDVDDQDTGIKVQEEFHFCRIISTYNCTDIHSLNQNVAFEDAVAFTINLVKNLAFKDLQENTQKENAKKFKILKYDDLLVAISDREMPWVHTKHFAGLADLVVRYDKNEENWAVQTVQLNASSYDTKHSIEPRGTNNEIFVHKAGFIGKYLEENNYVTIKLKKIGEVGIPV